MPIAPLDCELICRLPVRYSRAVDFGNIGGILDRFTRPFSAYALARLEQRVQSTPPFVGWGRFFVLDLQRREGLPTRSEGRRR